jgi:hypothetical protein
MNRCNRKPYIERIFIHAVRNFCENGVVQCMCVYLDVYIINIALSKGRRRHCIFSEFFSGFSL